MPLCLRVRSISGRFAFGLKEHGVKLKINSKAF